MPEREPLTVHRNRLNAKRTLRLHVSSHPNPAEPDLVSLHIDNRIGCYAFTVAMTRDEAQALAGALQDAAWGPPDA
jgi:hypothetical protein